MNAPSLLPTGRRDREPVRNLSRRGFLGMASGALLLGVGLRLSPAAAQAHAEGAARRAPKPGTRVALFLEIRPDNSVRLLSPFVEGGQGINTGLAQTIGEELDLDPKQFAVECAPAGTGLRGGQRPAHDGRLLLHPLQLRGHAPTGRHRPRDAAARCRRATRRAAGLAHHRGRACNPPRSGRALGYGELAAAALALQPRDDVPLKAAKDFRWIGKPVARLDMRDKSTGRAVYSIDIRIDGMLHAAVQHAPHLGTEPEMIANEAEVRAMPGVQAVQQLPARWRWWPTRGGGPARAPRPSR